MKSALICFSLIQKAWERESRKGSELLTSVPCRWWSYWKQLEREGRWQFSFRWCVQKLGYLGPLKHSLRRSIFKGVRVCLRFITVPIQGLWEFVLGISSMSQGSFLCLYLLAGKGLLMTNLCPWGTEPRQRCCCWAGRPPMTGPGSCWNSLLLTPLSPGLAPMQNQILSICSKTTAFWRGRLDSESSQGFESSPPA